MKVLKNMIVIIVSTLIFTSTSGATQTPLVLDLQPDGKNTPSPVMGDHLRFWSTITNTGVAPIEGLVAWISLVEVDLGNERPVDLEDWSAQKAITGAVLKPGQTLNTDWPMRLIKGGDYRAVVSVTGRDGGQVYTSPTVQFHVQQKPVLQMGRVLPVAAATPLLILGWMIFNKNKQKRKKV